MNEEHEEHEEHEEPLLTIEDAVRAFHVSAKTLRRRLAVNGIAQATQRPGQRGPEWVFPRSSLEAAGFRPRQGRGTAGSNATSTAAGEPRPKAMRRAYRGPARVLVALGLVILAIAAAVTVWDGGGESSTDAASADAVTSLLTELSEPGAPIGYAGTRALRLVPTDRVPVQVASAGDVADAPRYVVTVDGAGDPGAVVASLESSAKEVLAITRPAGLVRVFDRTATDDSSAPGPSAPAVPDPAPAAPPSGDPAIGGAGQAVTVQAGDHFWKLAEDALASSLDRPPTDAEILPFWLELIDLNQDILTEPGNPSLLLVGQTVRLPAG